MPSPEWVRRPELVKRLTNGGDVALALLTAPCGYGKSTLLSEWANADARPFVWVGLGRAELEDASNGRSVQQSLRDGLTELIQRARARHSRFVLVLDDAHVIASEPMGRALEQALKQLPSGSTIAVSCRADPMLPLGRLRAHGLLCEIRTQQLAMIPAEAEALLRQTGLSPELRVVQRLVSDTEGWPAALCLAALAARDDAGGLYSFDGCHHVVSDYLRDEALGHLPHALVDFSIRTSVLDELSGPACDAVLAEDGAASLLRELAQMSSLLMPLDTAHHRYRWHRLMREMLRGELRRLQPELEPMLRLRASAWFARSGDTDAAIAQTAAAGDAERTGQILLRNLPAYLTRGRNYLVRGWLSQFPNERIAGHASLALSASLSALVAGDMGDARRWSLKAAALLENDGAPGGDSLVARLTRGLAVVDALSGHRGAREMSDVALDAADSEPSDSAWRPVCLLLGGVGLYLQGDRSGAEARLEESGRMSGNRAPSINAVCLAQRAMLALDQEDWEAAAELSDRGVIAVEEWDLSAEPLSAIVYAVAAASRAHHGRIDEAKHDLRRGMDLLAALEDFAPWYEAETRVLLAHASLWLADIVRARTLLADASRFARRIPEASVFSRWFDSAWAYMDTLAETKLSGPSSLTIAELRILRFLPSHRSFREIASQLGVSANTVKTQAHAVYRKLGAASRSEAVSRAVESGLLGQ